MADSGPNPSRLCAPLEDWRRSLTDVPTLFGRLVFLASLRDSTGRYSDSRMDNTLGSVEADRSLRQTHRQVFQEWLNSSLADQKADLDEYMNDGSAAWSIAEFRDLVPRSARDVERQLYLTDLETLLELRKAERSAFPAPGA